MSTAEPTAACVLVMHPSGLVMAETHPKGLCLPGGKREPGETSLECAARELREETGIELASAASIGIYEIGAHVCEAWLAVSWVEPAGGPRGPHGCLWVLSRSLVASHARFPEACARIYAALVTFTNIADVLPRAPHPLIVRSVR